MGEKMEMSELERRAEEFAREKHKGRLRKDKVTLYIEHPKGVVDLLKVMGITDENVLAAGWLHDVIEDEGCTYEELKSRFNETVATYVRAVTRGSLEPKDDRTGYMTRIANEDVKVQLMKLADVVQNLSTIQFLKPEKQERMLGDIREYYLPMAKKACPYLYEQLQKDNRTGQN
jgi:(p)ppGpp synthase/HD superfamily hydrolase